MNSKNILYICLLLAFLITSCGSTKPLISLKNRAAELETSGNFLEATASWEEYFNQTDIDNIDGVDFANAAKTALKSNDLDKAKRWFTQARYKNYADAEMYKNIAEIYRKEKNISKELSALEYYNKNFSRNNKQINERLLAIYSEIKNNEKVMATWKNLSSESKNTEANLSYFFKASESLNNTLLCDSISTAILKINPDNVNALEWNAKKYYWSGQNRYKREMARYNKKKTRKTYKHLLKELDKVTTDFKQALPILNKLWKLEQKKEYAGYLANIHALFGNKKKTNYYKRYRK